MLAKSRSKYNMAGEKSVELKSQLTVKGKRNGWVLYHSHISSISAPTTGDGAPPLQEHQHSPAESPSASTEEPSRNAIENQSSIHTFSYPPPDKRAPLPPAKTPPQLPKNPARSQKMPQTSMGEIYQNCAASPDQLPNSPLPPPTPSPVNNVFDVTFTSSNKSDSPLDLAPGLSPDAGNKVAPLHSTSLPVGVGEAFGDEGDVNKDSLQAVRKNSYVNVKKTELGRMQSAPLTADPEYAEPIAVMQRGRVYSEQGTRFPKKSSHKPRPPPIKTEGFDIPTKISAATIIKNSLMNSSAEKLNMDSLSLEKIVEADEDETLPNGSRQGQGNTTPELYLEPVKTKAKPPPK